MLTQAKHGLLKYVFKRYFSWRLDALTGHQVALFDYPVSLEAPATYQFVPGLLGTSLWVELTR